MEKSQILGALTKAKENSVNRNFKQTFDLIINLKSIDLKKIEQQIDSYISLPHGRGKRIKVCAMIGSELEDSAKNVCDKYIISDDFQRYGKNEIKKLAQDFDYFIAQANLMPKIATVFGRIFGPRGKMPNPKAGCIVTPNANLTPLYDRLQKTVRVTPKKSPVLQCAVGTEDMNLEQVADNAMAVFNTVLPLLPNEKHSIKDVYFKLTMGKPVKLEEKEKETVKKGKHK